MFQKGTIEFRLFNSTTHAGKVKSYIQLCLAVSHQALSQRSASRRKTQSANEKYTFRTWLLRLGLIGDEFKTARLHLLEHLEGCIAWKDPAQAEQQKERIRQQKAQLQGGQVAREGQRLEADEGGGQTEEMSSDREMNAPSENGMVQRRGRRRAGAIVQEEDGARQNGNSEQAEDDEEERPGLSLSY